MRIEKDIKEVAFAKGKTSTNQRDTTIWKRVLLFGSLFAVAFLLGLIPMWLNATQTAQQRDAAQLNLRISKMQNRLATATINVRRGEYEIARVAASDFFTDLRSEIDRNESAFNTEQRKSVRPILEQRDDLITLLARNDQSTGDRLAELYLYYLQITDSTSKKTE